MAELKRMNEFGFGAHYIRRGKISYIFILDPDRFADSVVTKFEFRQNMAVQVCRNSTMIKSDITDIRGIPLKKAPLDKKAPPY